MCSSHELQATLNALGYLEDGEYYKGRDCLNASKDLIRFLRRDDPTEKTVRRELLKSDTITNDLIPLVKTIKAKKDAELFDLALRLLVNLTQSALNSFELKVPEDKLHYNIFIEIDNRLKSVKESFADEAFLRIICGRLGDIGSKEWHDRPEEDELVLERILYLIRNILLIKNSEHDEENRLETDLNSHDHLVLYLNKAGLFETIINMIDSGLNKKYTIHLMEIIGLLLKEQSAEELARVSENEANMSSKRSAFEREKDNKELEKIQLIDNQVRKHNKIRLNPRHSRFMGTYVAVNLKSINDENKLIVHKPARNMDDLLDDSSKKMVKKAKNKIVLEGENQPRKSVLFIRIILKKFCIQFLEKCYNTFFKSLKDLFQRAKLDDDETCQYYTLIQFFTEFARNSDKDEATKLELIKETFSLELFHSIEVFIQRCLEMMRVDKKQNRVWAKRMHTSVKCYKENMQALFVIEKRMASQKSTSQEAGTEQTVVSSIPSSAINDDELPDLDGPAATEDEIALLSSTQKTNKPSDPPPPDAKLVEQNFVESLKKIKDQLFYIQEFREMFIMLLKDFDLSKMTKNFLRDLIEANHVYLLMLEEHKKAGLLNVQCKKKKRKVKPRRKKAAKKKLSKEEKAARAEREREYQKRVEEQTSEAKTRAWETNADRVRALFRNEEELKVESDNLMPFDFVATSDADFDSHKEFVVEKIQRLLTDAKPDDSIALFREARFLFAQDRQLFGFVGIEPNEEFETYKELIMKKLEIKKPEEEEVEKEEDESQGKEDEKANENEEHNGNEELEGNEEGFNEEENEEQEEEEGKAEFVVEEENLDFERFLFRYTHPHVLKCYILMLGEYSKNSDFLNRCCLNMLERIAYECKAPQCLYQLSLFMLINKIYKDPLSRCIMSITEARNDSQRSIQEMCHSNYSVEDMLAFFRSLLKSFFEQTNKNPKLFLEVLFFKEKKIIFEIGEDSEGYRPATKPPPVSKEVREKEKQEKKEEREREKVEKKEMRERERQEKREKKQREKQERKEKREKERQERKEKKKKKRETETASEVNENSLEEDSQKSSKKRKAPGSRKAEFLLSDNDSKGSNSNSAKDRSLSDLSESSQESSSDSESERERESQDEKEEPSQTKKSTPEPEETSDSDDDLMITELIKAKRQKLILSDDDD